MDILQPISTIRARARAAAAAMAMAGAALLVAVPCAGQDAGVTPPAVGPDEALALFRQHSLELRAARADYRVLSGRMSQEAAYPNPSVSVVRENLGRAGEAYEENTFSLQQTVEWPGRTTARSRASDRRSAAARSAFRADSLRLVLEVRRSYLQAAEAERRVEVLEEVAGVFREAVEAGEARRTEGDVSGYELRRLRLERARLEQSLAAARIERNAVRRDLAARLVPRSDTVAVSTRGLPDGRPPTVGREEALSAALRRPAVAAGRQAVQAADAEARAERLRRVPDLRLTGGYKTQSDGFDGAVLGVSVNVPLFDRKGAAAGAAEARRDAAASRLGLSERRVRNEVLRALDRFRSVRRRSRVLADELLAPSEDLLEIARTAYDEGEMELVELLDGADAHLESRLTALELRAELWHAYWKLSRAMGGTPAGDDTGDGAFGGTIDREGDAR